VDSGLKQGWCRHVGLRRVLGGERWAVC
jgi:hypothetical protein